MEEIKKFFSHYGIAIFVKYFNVFEENKNERSNEAIYKAFRDNNETFSTKAFVSRASDGKSVFRKNKEVEALDYIINFAEKIDESVRNEARILRNNFSSTVINENIEYNNYSLSLEEERKVSNFVNKEDLTEEERKVLVKYRLGQSKYRENLIEYWKGCSVSGCKLNQILIASHIKPWNECQQDEKYHVFNGLLLTPNYDKLFDSYLISFDEFGKIMISDSLTDDDLGKLGISRDDKIDEQNLTLSHLYYLEGHRLNFSDRNKFSNDIL
ncbi:MAG: HNH endonuclease [Bacteroidota bacterium]